jgi:heptaprenyl diphosphate synthase component I
MALIKSMNFKSVSPIGISIVGSFFFNVGQLIVSAIVLSNIKIFYYLPYMSLFSILTGLLTGLSSLFLIRHINKIIRFEQK